MGEALLCGYSTPAVSQGRSPGLILGWNFKELLRKANSGSHDFELRFFLAHIVQIKNLT